MKIYEDSFGSLYCEKCGIKYEESRGLKVLETPPVIHYPTHCDRAHNCLDLISINFHGVHHRYGALLPMPLSGSGERVARQEIRTKGPLAIHYQMAFFAPGARFAACLRSNRMAQLYQNQRASSASEVSIWGNAGPATPVHRSTEERMEAMRQALLACAPVWNPSPGIMEMFSPDLGPGSPEWVPASPLNNDAGLGVAPRSEVEEDDSPF